MTMQLNELGPKIREIHVVLGANYGDEGKGYIVNKLVHELRGRGLSPAVVRYNSGGQCGHTVQHGPTKANRVVYHSYGSGSIEHKAPTLHLGGFVIDPVAMAKERNAKNGRVTTNLDIKATIASPLYLTTAAHVLANQIKERALATTVGGRHGSVGAGVWETMKCPDSPEDLRISSLHRYFEQTFRTARQELDIFMDPLLRQCKSWAEKVALHEAVETHPGYPLLYQFATRAKAFSEFESSIREVFTGDADFTKVDALILEGGQGLGLSSDSRIHWPHVSAAEISLKSALTYGSLREIFCERQEFNNLSDRVIFASPMSKLDIVAHFCTRPYLTRHGAGPIHPSYGTEVTDMEGFGFDIDETTNVTNEWQGAFRYGYLNEAELITRVWGGMRRLNSPCLKKSIIHVNYLNEAGQMPFTKMAGGALTRLEGAIESLPEDVRSKIELSY